VVKRRGEAHRLLWKEDLDFVRLAAKTNAVIVPFAAVGADDAFDLYMDTSEILSNPVLGPLATGISRRLSQGLDPDEAIFPITRIPGTQARACCPVLGALSSKCCAD